MRILINSSDVTKSIKSMTLDPAGDVEIHDTNASIKLRNGTIEISGTVVLNLGPHG